MRILFLSIFIVFSSCSTSRYSGKYSPASSYSQPFVLSSVQYYSCSEKYDSFNKLKVDFPTEPSCITTVSIASDKREAIAQYNQCLEDMKEYAGQLDQWIKCKNSKVLQFAKEKEDKLIDVFNTSTSELREYKLQKNKYSQFLPSKYMDDNDTFFDKCYSNYGQKDQCTFPLPDIPYCLEYSGFNEDRLNTCESDVIAWQSELKDWLKKQSKINVEIATNRLKDFSNQLQTQRTFLY